MKILFSFIIIALFAVSSGFAQQENPERDKAFEFYESGEYQKAVEIFRTVVETDKKDRRAWLFLALALAKTGKANDAIKAARKGASISVKNVPPGAYDKELKITSKPRASYTDEARKNQVTGMVRLVVEFGADGKIKAILPVLGLPDGLTEMCIEAAKKIRFEPAWKNEKPVPVVTTIEYSFSVY